ncbi:hypothetical protein QM996_07110 [Sinorhizobium chiapasense]
MRPSPTEALGFAAANVGEERTTSPQPERLSGIAERLQQETKQRYLPLRLKSPGAGRALIGTYSTGETPTPAWRSISTEPPKQRAA